jgi:hypothetical protein
MISDPVTQTPSGVLQKDSRQGPTLQKVRTSAQHAAGRTLTDERAARPYPGWKNMTKAERREFFGYKYEGEVAPLTLLTPESQAAAAAGEE